MNLIIPRKLTFSALIIFGLAIIAFVAIQKDQVEISDITWCYESGQYQVSFQAKNNSQFKLEAQIRINLHQRNFAGGSPKAEVIDQVGTIRIWAPLDAKQTITIKETIKPNRPTFKVDFVTINIVDIKKIDT